LVGWDLTPPPTLEEQRQMARIRARRAAVWLIWIGGLPAAYVTSRVSAIDLFLLGRVWIVGFGIAVIVHALAGGVNVEGTASCRTTFSSHVVIDALFLNPCFLGW
jgi:hypothetical protein